MCTYIKRKKCLTVDIINSLLQISFEKRHFTGTYDHININILIKYVLTIISKKKKSLSADTLDANKKNDAVYRKEKMDCTSTVLIVSLLQPR